MQQRAIDGWPAHWYNQEGCIPCPAQGCKKVFNSSNIGDRGYHWYWWHQETSSPGCNDHSVLLAIHRQKDCVYCDYRNDQSLKELLSHEQTQHGSSNMSTMQGYLYLMRRGLNTGAARACRDQAYERLVHNVWDSPYRDQLLYRVYPQLLPHEARIGRDLDPIFSHQNRQAGRAPTAVILAQDFLTHLRPKPGDQSAWPATYHELRARYAEGSI